MEYRQAKYHLWVTPNEILKRNKALDDQILVSLEHFYQTEKCNESSYLFLIEFDKM